MISRRTIAHMRYEPMKAAPNGVAFYYPENGDFKPMSNRDALDAYADIGHGLVTLGVERGDRVAVMANTRYEWELADGGAIDLGAVVVSIYPTSTQDSTIFILKHSGSKVAILENGEHWDLVAPRRGELPALEHIVVIEPAGMPDGDWISLDDLRTRGRQHRAEQPDLMSQTRDAIQPEDLASLMYTSGTTGEPKGVSLRHDMLFTVVEVLVGLIETVEDEHTVIYLPMSHILQRVNNYIDRYVPRIGYFAPAITELVATCQVANPRSVSGVPRLFEKIHARIMAGVDAAPEGRQRTFHKAIAVGKKVAHLTETGSSIPFGLRVQHALFERLVYKKLRTTLFGTNIEYLTCGAAPINRDLLDFFYAIGIPVLEGYGLTETCSPITLNLPERYRVGSVGPVLPGSEVRIAEDGEILLKGPSVFDNYYQNQDANAAAFSEDGWFMSGDIGHVDKDGFLFVTDRKKALIITASGKNIPPTPIEQKLMQHPLVGQVVVHGDKRKYLVALIALDAESVAAWAAKHGKAAIPAAELAADEAIVAELTAFVENVNGELAQYETIKQFRIVAEEFSVENGLLTPSLKIKRRIVEERYNNLLDEMYPA